MRIEKLAMALIGAGAAALTTGAAFAENIGVPRPDKMGFQPAATEPPFCPRTNGAFPFTQTSA